MSVTFFSNLPDVKRATREEVCLCSQMAPCWADAFTGKRALTTATRLELHAHANRDCHVCRGTGVEVVEYHDAPEFNAGNLVARRMLAAMGFASVPDPAPLASLGGVFDREGVSLTGERPIPEVRRGVIRAANSDLSYLVLRPEEFRASSRVRGDGVVELRLVVVVAGGVSVEMLRHRLRAFSEFVSACEKRGGTMVYWG